MRNNVSTSIFVSPVTGYLTLSIGHWDSEAKNLMQPLSVLDLATVCQIIC